MHADKTLPDTTVRFTDGTTLTLLNVSANSFAAVNAVYGERFQGAPAPVLDEAGLQELLLGVGGGLQPLASLQAGVNFHGFEA